jgi:hypothetical protein
MSSRMATSGGDRAELWERLSVVGRVVKLQLIATWTVRLLLVGLLVDVVWLAGARVFPYVVPSTALPAVPLALAALGALVLAFWRPSRADLALRADRRLGLKERLVTAVELQGRGARDDGRGSAGDREGRGDPAPTEPGATRLGEMQLRDAVAHFRRVDPLEAFPVRLRLRELNAVLALFLLTVGLAMAPNPNQEIVRQREQVQQAIRREADRLQKLAEQVSAANQQEQSPEVQQVEQALRDAARALEERSTNPEEAMAALAALEQRLQALQAQGSGDLEDALASLAGSLAQDPATRQAGTSLAKGDYKQAAEELRKVAQNVENMSPADRARMARSMRQAGQRAARSNPALGQSMSQAGNALEQGSAGEAQQGLDNAAGQMEQASGQLRAGGERERAMSQIQQSRGSIGRSAQQQQAQGRGQQQGQQGQGQSQGQGQNQSQGGARQPGAQPGGSQEGEGADGMPSSGQGQAGGESGEGDRPGGSSAGSGSNPNSRSDEIYDPQLAGRQERLGQDPDFDPNESYDNPDLEDGQRNDPQVGYRQVYPRYQEKASQSLQNSYIPIGLKDLVRDYFSSIQPEP